MHAALACKIPRTPDHIGMQAIACKVMMQNVSTITLIKLSVKIIGNKIDSTREEQVTR